MPETIAFEPSLLDTHLLVDARTPLEYEEDHLPGAVNVPLLSNEERVEIGIIHKERGPKEARLRGLALTAHRFPEIVDRVAGAAKDRPIVVYCWRGGLRSKTIATVLDLAGFPARQMIGGYKAFRGQVTACFENFRHPSPLVVLHGMTGIGKTTLLGILKERGFAVLDLEGLASHRGSAFGELGLTQSLTQKRFETLLWDAIRKLPSDLPLVLEGESQRIGRLSLPGDFYQKMAEGIRVWCHAPVPVRVERLIAEYGLPQYRDDMAQALERIKKRLGGKNYEDLTGNLERWEMEPFMTGLIEKYYDKVYYKTREWREDFGLSLEEFETAADELCEVLTARLGSRPCP